MNIGEVFATAKDLQGLMAQRFLNQLVALEKGLDEARRNRSTGSIDSAKKLFHDAKRIAGDISRFTWSPVQVEVASRFQAWENLGPPAIHRLDDLERKLPSGADQAYGQVAEWVRTLRPFAEALDATVLGLGVLLKTPDTTGGNLVTLFLENKAVRTPDDLSRVTKDWAMILEDAARSLGKDPERVKVVGGLQGSFGVEWQLDPEMLKWLGEIVKLGLETRLAWLLLKVHELQVERNPLIPDQVKEAARQQVEAQKTPADEDVERLLDAVVEAVKADPEKLGRSRLVVRKTVEYVVEGALVDPRLPQVDKRTELGELQRKAEIAAHEVIQLEAGASNRPRIEPSHERGGSPPG